MKYKAITDSVKTALGLPSGDDARLLSELNLLRLDVSAHTDWLFLRKRVSDDYAAGTPLAIPDTLPVLGVRAVLGAGGRVYYHGSEGMLPTNVGVRFWTYTEPTGAEVFAKAVRIWDANLAEVTTETLTVRYWTAPAELTSETLATQDLEFPGAAAFVAGLHGRWLRYQELKVEAAGPYEQQFASELATMAARNPQGAVPPTFSRGGVMFSTSDRI